MLDHILKEAGISREEISIINCVKCRPPQNRQPKIDELFWCYRYLEAQLLISQPSVVIPVGVTAAHNLLGSRGRDLKLKELKKYWPKVWGKQKQITIRKGFCSDLEYAREIPDEVKFEIIVSYHPSYLLRQRKKIEESIGYFKRAYAIYNSVV